MNEGDVIVFQKNKIVGPQLGVVEKIELSQFDIPHRVILQSGEKIDWSEVIGKVQLVQYV